MVEGGLRLYLLPRLETGKMDNTLILETRKEGYKGYFLSSNHNHERPHRNEINLVHY